MHDRKSDVRSWKIMQVLKNPSPEPSSQSIHLEMADAGIRDPLMHLFFVRARVTANLARMKDTARLHHLAQHVARFLPNLLKKNPLLFPLVLRTK